MEHDGELKMCASGLHASPTAFQALKYAPGSLLHRVELGGKIIHESDKSVASKRKIVATIDASDLWNAAWDAARAGAAAWAEYATIFNAMVDEAFEKACISEPSK